jgi:hypothetical protein
MGGNARILRPFGCPQSAEKNVPNGETGGASGIRTVGIDLADGCVAALLDHGDPCSKVLSIYGLVEPIEIGGGLKGYRIDASIIEWREGDLDEAARANRYFRSLYENVSAMLAGGGRFLHQLEAREHTAQVDSEVREDREREFRKTRLPVVVE